MKRIEPLEARVAPAATFTFTDIDGDIVTVKTSKGTVEDLGSILVFNDPSAARQQLQKVDFSRVQTAAIFDATNLTITARASSDGGDGFVNVGYIDATGGDGGLSVRLGTVSIRGDLGRISTEPGTGLALSKLTVQSLGAVGLSSQAAGGTLNSDITGNVGSITIKTNVVSADLDVSGTVEKITVGGSLIGGVNGGGSIRVEGDVGTILVKGSIIGRGGEEGGSIGVEDIQSLVIRGSIVGSTSGGGEVRISGTAGAVTIGGDIQGGATLNSGNLFATGGIKVFTIHGSVTGGSGNQQRESGDGQVQIGGRVDVFTVGRNLEGANGIGSGSVMAESFGKVTVRGSVIGGASSNTGQLISRHGPIGSVVLGGSLLGGSGADSGAILARGGGFSQVDASIGSVTIAGSILGAGDRSGRIHTDSGGIGNIKVGGSLVGGTGIESGRISNFAFTDEDGFGHIRIGGSILGGTGADSGSLEGINYVRSVNVGGDLRGGGGTDSGRISFNEHGVGNITIGGSVVGSGGLRSGSMAVSAENGPHTGKFLVKGSVIGGNGGSSGSITAGEGGFVSLRVLGSFIGGVGGSSGQFDGDANIRSIYVGGSVIGGVGVESGVIEVDEAPQLVVTVRGDLRGGPSEDSGGIRGELVKGIVVGGSLIGSTTGMLIKLEGGVASVVIHGSIIGGSGGPAGISVETTVTDPLAIGSIRVGGDVVNGTIRAGFFGYTPQRGDAQIGSVFVGGDWVASTIFAGATGTNDASQILAGNTVEVISQIASIFIRGAIVGTFGGTDSFGFAAEHIGSLTIGGVTVFPLQPGKGNDKQVPLGTTGDVFLHELGLP